jgi:hypothetical protein
LHVTIGVIFLLFCFVRSILTASPLVAADSELVYLFKKLGYIVGLTKFPKLTDEAALKEIHNVQENLSLYAFSRYQHFGFEAAA